MTPTPADDQSRLSPVSPVMEMIEGGIRRYQQTTAQYEQLLRQLDDHAAALAGKSMAVQQAIQATAANAAVGTDVPPMLNIPAPLRGLARIVARLVLYAASFITDRQRSYNKGMISAMELLMQSTNESAANLATTLAGIREAAGQQIEAMQSVAAHQLTLVHVVHEEIASLKAAQALQQRQFASLAEGQRLYAGTAAQEQPYKPDQEMQHALDPLYADLERRFRGTREELTAKHRRYLPLIRAAGAGTTALPVLDLGCGRGEWLELLANEGFVARGVDLNRIFIAECRQRGLPAEEADVMAYLAALPDGSLGGVTGIHLVEHLPFETLITLLDESLRVLKPGGIAIFETPNPQNVMVGTNNFYFDPTHRQPLPILTMKFLLEARGFTNVHWLPVSELSTEMIAEDTEIARRFNAYFYAPMDYAIIGTRP
jgi:O-antigen chain-terminating methyltransferase